MIITLLKLFLMLSMFKKFIYSPQLSKDLRKELNLENKFVIGHVGRFDYQKNHDFLLKVFVEVVNERGRCSSCSHR